jgi:hypothetical protein
MKYFFEKDMFDERKANWKNISMEMNINESIFLSGRMVLLFSIIKKQKNANIKNAMCKKTETDVIFSLKW